MKFYKDSSFYVKLLTNRLCKNLFGRSNQFTHQRFSVAWGNLILVTVTVSGIVAHKVAYALIAVFGKPVKRFLEAWKVLELRYFYLEIPVRQC